MDDGRQQKVRILGKGGKSRLKRGITVVLVVVVVFLLKHFGLFQYLCLDKMSRLKEWILSFGALGSVFYVLVWIAACVFFLLGLPVVLLGGSDCGPFLGTALFPSGRFLRGYNRFSRGSLRCLGMVEGWVEGNGKFRKIEEGVRKQGWRMLRITRFVPAFTLQPPELRTRSDEHRVVVPT